MYSGLKLKQYTTIAKTFLEINLTFLTDLFTSYFNLLYVTGFYPQFIKLFFK